VPLRHIVKIIYKAVILRPKVLLEQVLAKGQNQTGQTSSMPIFGAQSGVNKQGGGMLWN